MSYSYLMHYGTKRHSGRYPWGSGDDPYQHESWFLNTINEYKAQGMSEKEIAQAMGFATFNEDGTIKDYGTSKLRGRITREVAREKRSNIEEAEKLKAKGWSNEAIGEKLGVSEATVRNYLKPSTKEKNEIFFNTAEMLKDAVAKNKYIDVGVGSECYMGVSRTKLKAAIKLLEDEGYKIHYIKELQPGTGEYTSIMVLGDPESTYAEVFNNRADIKMTTDHYTDDGGKTWYGIETPQSISSDRIAINYAEDGGTDKDGVIELRRGVEDLSLGSARYAQVRIAVDDSHYLKGMAVYSDDLPDGVDVRFNTNKSNSKSKMEVLKEMKEDEDNPFGATVRQKKYIGEDGQEHLSPLNIVNEEGDWTHWSKTISTQMMAKQSPDLAKKQLDKFYSEKEEEYNEIMSLNNNAIKKRLLMPFADQCDADAVELQAAGLTGQSWNVILPVTSMSENKIYAPKYQDGEEVVLIRYPHAGLFEIPRLTVDNKNQEAKNVLGTDPKDAVGINSKVASQLSGADFDGDTVLVIPTKSNKIKSSSPLEQLKDFDPKQYKLPDDAPANKEKIKNQNMGSVSNLITDMTIKGASEDEIARAVKHSMVVIDSVKHHLDYEQSYIDNGIAELKTKYQGGPRSGASTLISRATSEVHIPARTKGQYVTDEETGKTKKLYIDPATGKKLYTNTNEVYVFQETNKKGETVTREIPKTTTSTKLAETDDAFKLSSGSRIETVYATHSNKLKSLANTARLEYLNTPDIKRDSSAARTFADAVSSLKAKLELSKKNKPLERQAILVANKVIKAKKEANPGMTKEEEKKVKSQALTEARRRMGSSKKDVEIKITPYEWKAIQAGAISNNVLTQILDNTNLDVIRNYATPRKESKMTTSMVSRAKSMLRNGNTQAEVAESLGVSVTTMMKAVEEA